MLTSPTYTPMFMRSPTLYMNNDTRMAAIYKLNIHDSRRASIVHTLIDLLECAL